MIGGASVRLILDAAAFEAGLTRAQGRLATFGRGVGRVGTAMTRGLTVPLVAAGAVSVKMAMDFEQAFTRIGALSNTSRQDLNRWKEDVLDLAGTTAQAPEELANALFFLASAGLKTNQVMPALEMSAKAAATGMGEITDIAKLTAASMNAYSKQGLTAAQATDTLAAAIKAGSAEPAEFAEGMGRVLGIAANVGVEFDELAASLAVLSNVGVDVSEGVTAVRSLLMSLEAPTQETRDMLDDLGISVQGLRDRIEDDLLGALRFLFDATGGNIDQLDKLIPNVRGLAGYFNITGQEAKKVDDVFADLTHTTGDMGEAFGETQKDPAFKFKQTLTDLRVAAIRVGQVVLPVVTEIVEGIGDLAKSFSSMGEGARKAWIKVALILAVAGPVLKGVSGLIGVVTALKVALAGTGAAGAAAGAGAAGAGAAGGAAGGASLLSKGLALLTTPVGIVATGFGALVLSLKKWGDEANATEHRTNVLMQALLSGETTIDEVRERFGDLPDVVFDVEEAFTSAKRTAHAYFTTAVEDARRHKVYIDENTQATVRNLIETGNFAGALRVLKGAIEDLPPKVQTAILTPGLQAAQTGVRQLIDSLAALPASKTIAINIRREGNLQHGGVNIRGGAYMVGERGPELVLLPRGSDVIPSNRLGSMGGPRSRLHGGGPIFNTVVTVDGDAGFTADEIVSLVERAQYRNMLRGARL